MASPGDIAIVRVNTAEPNDVEPYTDSYIGGLIDASGVTGATLTIWEQKLATFSTSVDVTEAGASHKFSDLFKNAQAMVAYWQKKYDDENGGSTSDGVLRVKVIERSS